MTYFTVSARLLALAVLFASCDRTPDIAQPKSYDQHGIAFSFPGNWRAGDDVTRSGEFEFRHVTVESDDALLMILKYPPGIDETLEEFAKDYIEGVVGETDALLDFTPIDLVTATADEGAPVQFSAGKAPVAGIEHSFSISMLGQRVSFRARVFRIETADSVAFVVTQAPAEDWSTFAPGFDFVLASLTFAEQPTVEPRP